MTTRAEGAQVTGKIGFSGHPMIEHFKFVDGAHQAHAEDHDSGAVGARMAGRCRRRSTRRSIPKLDALLRRSRPGLPQGACAPSPTPAAAICSSTRSSSPCCAIRNIAQQMQDRGDDPEKLGELYGDLINTAMSDIPSDMTITMHLCRGNYKSTFMGAGGYDAVQEILFNSINVHGYFMEYDDERAGGFEPLRMLPKGKHVVLGLVTTKTGQLESKDELKRRIDEAAKFAARSALSVAAMRLRLDREKATCWRRTNSGPKLRMIAELSKEVWG